MKASVEESFKVGQQIDVKYVGKNDKGQLRLSRRAVMMRESPLSATGEPLNQATDVLPAIDSNTKVASDTVKNVEESDEKQPKPMMNKSSET
jgi:predicted RNA-binding protein with RPS1 domain